jgi:hypothetical protein
MALGTYTLLDLASRSSKNVQAVMEGVLTFAPELMVFPCFPRAGLTYSTLTRTEIPTGAFRSVGGGVPVTKSAWAKKVGSMAVFEAAMRVPEDIVVAAQSENADLILGDLLADEAIATVRGSAITIGSQVWYGQAINSAGFVGLSTQIDTNDNEINAGGSGTASSSSAYLVYLDNNVVNPQGIHFLLGNSGRMTMNDVWLKQQLAVPGSNPTALYMAYINNFLAFLGFVMARPQNAYRVKNITTAYPFTDAIAAALLAKVPYALQQDLTKWRWMMNTQARLSLQASRATVNVATPANKGLSAGGVYPEMPVSAMGIPIQVTDSLLPNEHAGLFQSLVAQPAL